MSAFLVLVFFLLLFFFFFSFCASPFFCDRLLSSPNLFPFQSHLQFVGRRVRYWENGRHHPPYRAIITPMYASPVYVETTIHSLI